MNMGFIKRIYVLTLVIIIIIINDHKSDANYCLQQIIGDGNMKITFNGQEAFKHAYLHLRRNELEPNITKYILNNYFEFHLYKVIHEIIPERPLSPLEWKEQNCPNSLRIPFIDCNTFDLAKREAYLNNTKDYFDNPENYYADDANKGYYEYILSILLPLVPRANIRGPLKFCNSYTVLKCKSQILFGKINYDFTGKEAFSYIYHYFNNDGYSDAIDILHQYTQDLFDAVVPLNIQAIIHDPSSWCMNGLVNTMDLSISEKENKCREFLDNTYYAYDEATISALTRSFFSYHSDLLVDDISIKYYSFLFERLTLSIKFENAISPRKYCETHFQPVY